MRTFIDVRFYLDVEQGVKAEDVAAQLASKVSDAARYRVRTHRMLGFGTEAADGTVHRVGEQKERTH